MIGGTMPVTTLDVAVHLPTRPKLSGGAVAPDFTTETYPSAAQVLTLITSAGDYVGSRVGPISDPALVRNSDRLIAILSAMYVELGFYPEQVNNDRSPYKELKKLFDEGIAALIEAVGGEGGSAVDDTGVLTDLMPRYAFPITSVGDGIMP